MQLELQMRLTGKVALITGAAYGMGESAARLFAREGAKVVVADIDEVLGRTVSQAICADGGESVFVPLEVSDASQWQAAVADTLKRYGRVDILVNNAGVSGALQDRMSIEHFDRIMAVNARGTFLGMQAVIPHMERAGGGAIVNLSSISGVIGQESVHMGYNGAKGAIRAMTKSAAVQFGPKGIRVNSVHPGMMPPMRTSQTASNPEMRAKVIGGIPLRRAGTADEAAYAMLFLASDEASYITGAELAVDGGYLAV
jgi:3(or 17)beta-hydroxysteroid dehydrogenase